MSKCEITFSTVHGSTSCYVDQFLGRPQIAAKPKKFRNAKAEIAYLKERVSDLEREIHDMESYNLERGEYD